MNVVFARVDAADVIVTGTALNPLLGNYLGTLTGAISGIGIPSQGIVRSVDQTGKMTISIPGLGTGTVTPNGQCRATARFVLHRNYLTASFVGTLVAAKSPSTGKVISVVGVGKWIIRQTP